MAQVTVVVELQGFNRGIDFVLAIYVLRAESISGNLLDYHFVHCARPHGRSFDIDVYGFYSVLCPNGDGDK